MHDRQIDLAEWATLLTAGLQLICPTVSTLVVSTAARKHIRRCVGSSVPAADDEDVEVVGGVHGVMIAGGRGKVEGNHASSWHGYPNHVVFGQEQGNCCEPCGVQNRIRIASSEQNI
jgi:hypothetical protein